MSKPEFVDMITTERRTLNSVLSKFTRDQMEIRMDENEWTVKDTILHIRWYETEMVNVLGQRSLEGSDLWEKSLDERNDIILLAGRDEELESVLESEAQCYKTMLELLEALDDSDLNDPAAFRGMPPDWLPWSVIASNTYEHYQDHKDQLEKLLRIFSN